ncbi:MAG: Gfo/Idh/MocA family oxidoreductase [bacterium]|nr:Gfo/Idh/MocA family oxidoreductase [bacterium]
MTSPLRLGIIGAGAIANTHMDAIGSSERVDCVGIADTDLEAAQKLSRDACPSYATHRALIDAGECEAAIVCTPPSSHQEIATDLLESGISVLCEKPLAPCVDQAREMIDLARRKSVLFTMASKFRFVEDIVSAREFLEQGRIGEVILFENVFTGYVDMRQRWNSRPELSGGGVLIDNGTHSVDIMRYFLGPIAEVHALEGKRAQGLDVEDTVRLFVRSVDGVVGNIDLSWSLSKSTPYFIEIYGSKGSIHIGWQGSILRTADDGEALEFGSGYRKVDAFRAQLENLADAHQGESELRIGPEDALASVFVVEAAYRSMREDHWVSVRQMS